MWPKSPLLTVHWPELVPWPQPTMGDQEVRSKHMPRREKDGKIWQTGQRVIRCYHPCWSSRSAWYHETPNWVKHVAPTWISLLKIEHLTCPKKVTWLPYFLFMSKSGVSWKVVRKRPWYSLLWIIVRCEVLSSQLALNYLLLCMENRKRETCLWHGTLLVW